MQTVSEHRGQHFRLYPTADQRHQLAQFFGYGCYQPAASCGNRKVYNVLLPEAAALSPFQLKDRLVDLKKDLPYLEDAPSQALQSAALNLGQAQRRFELKLGDAPTTKKKRGRQSITLPQGFIIVEWRTKPPLKKKRKTLPAFGTSDWQPNNRANNTVLADVIGDRFDNASLFRAVDVIRFASDVTEFEFADAVDAVTKSTVKSALSIRQKKRTVGLVIPKLDKPIKCIVHRPLPSAPTCCYISREPDGSYYVSFSCVKEFPLSDDFLATKATQPDAAVDIGQTDFAVVARRRVGKPSEDPASWMLDHTPAPRFLRQAESELKFRQRSRDRKANEAKKQLAANQAAANAAHKAAGLSGEPPVVKPALWSERRQKAADKYTKLSSTVKHQRLDFIHQMSRSVVRENQSVAAEGIDFRHFGLGTGGRKSARDAGFGMYRARIQYKAVEEGTDFRRVDRWKRSTGVCPYKMQPLDRKLRLDERSWHCSHCGREHQRDEAASQTLVRLGEDVAHLERANSSTKVMSLRDIADRRRSKRGACQPPAVETTPGGCSE